MRHWMFFQRTSVYCTNRISMRKRDRVFANPLPVDRPPYNRRHYFSYELRGARYALKKSASVRPLSFLIASGGYGYISLRGNNLPAPRSRHGTARRCSPISICFYLFRRELSRVTLCLFIYFFFFYSQLFV